jgi:aspartate dehydrogenase
LKIGIVGLGAIGAAVATRIAPPLELVAVSGRESQATAAKCAVLGLLVPATDLATLVAASDVVVDCAVAASFRSVAEASLAAGRVFVTVNAAALLDHLDLVELARAKGGRIVVATGALLALDAVAAAALGRIQSVTMRNRKPPLGLKGAPYIVENGIDLAAIATATCVFRGTARAAAKGFPANVNVAAALSLAGAGPDQTMVEIWADPALTRNVHEFDLVSDSVSFSVRTEGLPSPDNPKTSAIVPLSVLATLQRLASPLRIGT